MEKQSFDCHCISQESNEVQQTTPFLRNVSPEIGAMREDNGEHQHIIVPTGETLESAKQRQHLSSPRNGAIGRNDDGMQMAQREGTGRNQQQDGGEWQQKKPTNQDVNSPFDGRTSSIESWRGVRGSDRAQAAEELWREQDEASIGVPVQTGMLHNQCLSTMVVHRNALPLPLPPSLCGGLDWIGVS